MALDFNKAAKSLLLDLINTKATRALAEQELQFGTPQASSEHSKNTVIQLDAAAEAETCRVLSSSTTIVWRCLTFSLMHRRVTFELPHGTDSIQASDW